ncbi:MAG: right-handed parallel beta-helix repeat-containing protein [Puniceicoccaceae bacterium]
MTTLSASRAYFVAPDGLPGAAGTIENPLASIQKAVDLMEPGDVCYIRAGTYREEITVAKSGSAGKPIRLEAYSGELVILDGTEVIHGEWTRHDGSIFKTKLDTPVEQLFVGKRMMIEARWPNMTFEQRYDRSRWAKVDAESTHGKVFSKEVAESGIDWTGAMACLNVAHQWWTWNRPITSHEAGSEMLEYPANLVGLCNYDPAYEGPDNWSKNVWKDDYLYLFGKLEALDVETEWFYEKKSGYLYFHAPGDVDPTNLEVKYKSRDYALFAADQKYIEISGINFFGTTFRLEDCDHCLIEDCELLYPSYSRTITEYDEDRKESVITKIVGNHNTVRRCSMAYANNMGLMVMGGYNSVENCIIHDVNWFGTLIYPALQLSASPHLGVNWFDTIQYPPTVRTEENSEVTSFGNRASRNTLFNGGNALLVYHAAESIVEYNHVYNGGLACKDVSLIYGCWPFSRGSIIRYNWVHDCYPDHGGIGIRADDQSRNNIFHHNVVWNCGGAGIIAKGDDNLIFNNTIINIGGHGNRMDYIFVPTRKEPFKQWAVQWPQLEKQNQQTQIINNISFNIKYWRGPDDILEENDNIRNNLTGIKKPGIKDLDGFDFMPLPGSGIIDQGVVLPGYTDGFAGIAPDLGAYESDKEAWVAGADWQESYTLINRN